MKNEKLVYIGKQINKACIDAELTKEELAEKVGKTFPTISAMTNGKSNFKILTLLEIANVLGKDIKDFF